MRNLCLCAVFSTALLMLTGCTMPALFAAKPDIPAAATELPPQNVPEKASQLLSKAQKLWVGDEEICTEPEKAIAMLDATLELAPDYADALMWRGRALGEAQYLADSFDDLTKAIQIRPTARAYAERALTGMRLGNFDGANSDIDMALTLNPKEARAYFYRSGSRFLHGDDENACADLANACKYGLCQPLELAQRDKVCR